MKKLKVENSKLKGTLEILPIKQSASLGTDLFTEKLIDIFAVADMVDFNKLLIFADFINDSVALGPE